MSDRDEDLAHRIAEMAATAQRISCKEATCGDPGVVYFMLYNNLVTNSRTLFVIHHPSILEHAEGIRDHLATFQRRTP